MREETNTLSGEKIKQLLIVNQKDLNEFNYFDNNTEYTLDKIPNVLVTKEKLFEKLKEKYGAEISNYIVSKTYDKTETDVNPMKIIEFMKKLN
jgi:hypothetical protein